MNLACALSASPVWAHQWHERNHASVGKKPRHFGHPTHVLVAVLSSKAKISIDSVTKVVAIEHVRRLLLVDEQSLYFHGNRRLARTRESGEPDRGSAQAKMRPSFGAVVVTGVPNDVGCALGCVGVFRPCLARRLAEDHAGCDGGVGGLVDKHETTGIAVATVLVDKQWHGRAEVDTTNLIERKLRCLFVAVKRVDVESLVDLFDHDSSSSCGVLDRILLSWRKR